MADVKQDVKQPDMKAELDTLKRQMAALLEQNAALKDKLLAIPSAPPPAPRLPKTSGTFRLTEPHYRAGKYYQAGELITVVDEEPGASWVPYVEAGPELPAPAPLTPQTRPSDKPVA